MALIRNKPRTYTAPTLGSLPLSASTLVYEGAAIGIDASTGKARSLVAGDDFAGFARWQASSMLDAAGATPTDVNLVASGEVTLAVSQVVTTSVGASVYATDDDSFALYGVSAVGTIVRVPSAGVAVVAFSALPTALSAARLRALREDPTASGTGPQRVFVLGDSISNRQFQTIATLTTSVSGDTLTFTSSNAAVPVGAGIRVTNQTAIYDEVGVVTASNASNFSAQFSRDLTGLVSGTCIVYIYSRGNDSGWINYARGLLAQQGKPINIVRSAAVGGAKVADMLVRLRSEILPRAVSGDVLWFMGGINDVEVTDTSTTDAPNTIATIKTIFDEALAAGLTIHASTVTPAQSSAYFAVAATGLAQIAAINGYIRARCASEARAKCFDSWAATNSGGSYAASGMMESAGVHPLPAGGAAIGARYVTDCGADIRKGCFRRWMSDADNYVDSSSWNLLTNCQFAGATGSTAPTGWTASGTSNTFTLSAGAVAGNDLSIAKAAAAANSTTLYQDITARVSAGDRLLFGTEQETITIGQGHYLYCDLVITVGGVEQIYGIGRQQHTVANGGALPPTGSRWFHEFTAGTNDGRAGCVVPTGFTSVVFRYTVRQDSVGSLEVKIARPHVYKVGSALA